MSLWMSVVWIGSRPLLDSLARSRCREPDRASSDFPGPQPMLASDVRECALSRTADPVCSGSESLPDGAEAEPGSGACSKVGDRRDAVGPRAANRCQMMAAATHPEHVRQTTETHAMVRQGTLGWSSGIVSSPSEKSGVGSVQLDDTMSWGRRYGPVGAVRSPSSVRDRCESLGAVSSTSRFRTACSAPSSEAPSESRRRSQVSAALRSNMDPKGAACANRPTHGEPR